MTETAVSWLVPIIPLVAGAAALLLMVTGRLAFEPWFLGAKDHPDYSPATCSTRCSECGLYDCGYDYCRCEEA